MKAGPGGKEAARQDLLARLQQLRRVARQTSEMHLAALQGEVVQLIERVGGAEGEKPLSHSVMRRMIAALEGPLAKEPKGSLKALRRIETALDEAARLARAGSGRE